MRKIMMAAVLLTSAALLLSGCDGGGKENGAGSSPAEQSIVSEEGFPVTIDNYNSQGEKVKTVYHKQPSRIIALWQNSVETIIQLGGAGQIIAAAGIDNPAHLTEEDRKVYETLPVVSKQNLN